MKYFFCLFLLFNNLKAAYRVMGTGSQNCETITLHSNIEEARLLTISWVQGFLTGLNLAMSKEHHTIGNNIFHCSVLKIDFLSSQELNFFE